MSPLGPPDPSVVSAALDDSLSNKPWLASEARRLNGPVNRMMEMGLGDADGYDAYRGAQAMTGQRSSILNSIPAAHSDREHYEIIQYFDEGSGAQLEGVGGHGMETPTMHSEWGSFVRRDPSESGWMSSDNYLPLGSIYNNGAQNPMPFAAEYAAMTEVPTSTTDPLRPRTIAAGYDSDGHVLTVMFRDGTLYNYFEVSPTQWYNFRRARSKGRFILTYLDQKPRGVAETGNLTPAAAETFARIARTAQTFKGGLNDNHSAKSKRGAQGSYRKGNLGGSTRAKARTYKNL